MEASKELLYVNELVDNYTDATTQVAEYFVKNNLNKRQYQSTIDSMKLIRFVQLWGKSEGGWQTITSQPALFSATTTVFLCKILKIAIVYFSKFAYVCDINDEFMSRLEQDSVPSIREVKELTKVHKHARISESIGS